VDELKLLQSRFPDSIRLFGSYKEERLLASALVYDFGQVAHVQYVANSEEGREVGAPDMIIAHLIENVFSSRRYFSFGSSNEQEGRYLNEGLIFQKEGFGGRGVAQDFYELDLSKSE
jgi:Acetyltransferase (GNAT) domain